ncbi:TetR/AcrR family transcriptional regulator [Paenibacillus prosopidis]|uniref:TetR family transcriptional regulator n=1 Tax=Paenibacillus prosopidis TaxID=630520 RepID=A0A368VT93_9BACL|nr:TetR/AcrR family transcriptional regulator [Paenibacillus prosopidis]RCW44920.1 TetR family transcriptional regulator [Paenibacillus prosopidis]
MIGGPSTAERIKLAAVTMFAESGYEGTSLSEIANAVGIKTPSIYAHYKSKEHLFLQLIQEVIAEEREQYMALIQAVQKEPIKQQIYKLFDFFTDLSHLTTGQAFLKRTILMPPRHLRDQLRRDFLRYENELSEGLAAIMRKGVFEGIFDVRDEERMIAAFYVCVDGLLVENQLYEDKLYNERKQMVWLSLWQLWTMTAREE